MNQTKEDREYFHGEYQNQVKKDYSTTLSIAKVFGYMFGLILITALVALGVGAAIYYGVIVPKNTNGLTAYFAILITSAVLLFIDLLVINFVLLRGKHSIAIPAIIYSMLVGALFSCLTIVVDWKIIGMAFGITSLIFLLMSLIAFLSKGNLSPLLLLAMGLMFGAGLMALTTWIFALISGTVFNILYFVISLVILAVIMLVSIYDIWRMKKIAESGAMNNNLALYCAFTMYTDFIIIFVRILYFLILIFGNKK